MKVSIIVPVYNEEKTVSQILERIKKVKLSIEKEIIVIDDSSTDNTLTHLQRQKNIILISHEENKGKGAAIKSGLERATGDIILIQDADLEYDPEDYPKLIKPILENEVYVVYGSRFLNKKFKVVGKNRTILPIHLLGNKVLSLIASILYGPKLTDMETCYKVFKKEVIKDIHIKSNRFEFEPEITSKILKKGYKIKEIPINYNPRSFKEGKKITAKDGIKSIYSLIKYRFND